MRIFIGYDPAETVAYHVLCHSILRHSSKPVSFTPINKRNIPEFTRGIEDGSTEFSFSRFLTPYLAGYQGDALFMDCDMLVTDDIHKILEYKEPGKDVYVVKHDYTPKTEKKFLGNKQHAYPKKNWSSVMLFECSSWPIKKLTPEVVNTATGKYLHQFEWTTEERIGELPKEWNHLVGEYDPNPNAKIVHYTLGTPCFNEYRKQEWASEWFKEKDLMNYAYNSKVLRPAK
jgi:lipopolysaccharide biosynthesis glycosyltransferase